MNIALISKGGAKSLPSFKFILLLLMFVFFQSCAIVGCRDESSRFIEPNQPVKDLNPVVSKICKKVYVSKLYNGLNFEIYASSDLPLDCPKIQEVYDTILKNIARDFGRSTARGIRLVVLPVEEEPKNYIYKPRCKEYTDFFMIKITASSNVTNTILEELSLWQPHELWHQVSESSRVFCCRGNCYGGGWFEEGLAEYTSYLYPISKDHLRCPEEKAIAAFADPEIRAYALYKYCAGCDFREKMKEMDKQVQDLTPFWNEVDKGYDAALGAFIFLEKKVGREKLSKTIKAVMYKPRCQDEQFYQDLASHLGFDIRKVTKQEIEKTFEERN